MASFPFRGREKSSSFNPRLQRVGDSCPHLPLLSSVDPRVRPGQSFGPSTVFPLTIKVKKTGMKTQLPAPNREHFFRRPASSRPPPREIWERAGCWWLRAPLQADRGPEHSGQGWKHP